MDWTWSLDPEACTGCGICADLCPHSALDMPSDQAWPTQAGAACTGCMACVEECPFEAILLWRRAMA